MKLIGHRGHCSTAPENTLSAIKHAIEFGADGVELDIRLTKDLVPVIIHDHKVSRTTNGHGLLEHLNLDEVRALDAGSWFHEEFTGEKIPTLEEVIKLAEEKVFLHLEIKSTRETSTLLVEKVIEIIKKYKAEDNCELMSFSDRVLDHAYICGCNMNLRKLFFASYYRMPFIVDHAVRIKSLNTYEHIQGFNGDFFITKQLIDYIHAMNKQIFHGALVNVTEEEFDILQGWKLDGLMRNDVRPYVMLERRKQIPITK